MSKLVKLAVLGGLVYAAKRYLDSNPDARHKVRDAGDRAQAGLRKTAGQVRGRAAQFGSSSEDVDEVTLADRVRSQLGPLEKRLDVPRVLVTVEGTTVKLHGEVPSPEDARTLENAAREVRGVTALESHLAVGLSSGATRPSESRSA
jgi:osmotically-inducible protein OsmY